MPDEYDVFLSHNAADKPAVEAIAVRLQDEANLRPFLDKWHLIPGESWIPAIERAIEGSTTVAVFVGPQGVSAWHDEEKQLALDLVHRARRRGRRVIPVLLPGAHGQDVEGFLSLRTWVDLAEDDGFLRLVAGITGRAPQSLIDDKRPRPSRSPTPVPPASRDEGFDALVDELARVFYKPEEAELLVRRTGFPTQHMPRFTTALVFWSLVVQEIRNGRIRSVQTLIDEAAKLYPANAFFARRARTS